MKVAYVHREFPNQEKRLDTHKLYKETYIPFVKAFFPGTTPQTEEEWTKGEMERLEEKHRKGIILSYKIINEGENDGKH